MIKFEDKIECIDKLILKNKGRWRLADMEGLSFDDVAQIIRLHIYNKWSLWDQERPFECWCNKLIIHQITNCVRNVYYKDAPPCSSCPFDRDGELCGYTSNGLKCAECPAYKKWSKKKQSRFLLKTATSINTETYKETPDHNDPSVAIKIESSIPKFHAFILSAVPEKMGNWYKLMYIDNLSDAEIITLIKQKTNKVITKRQLALIRKQLQEIAKDKIKDFDIDV